MPASPIAQAMNIGPRAWRIDELDDAEKAIVVADVQKVLDTVLSDMPCPPCWARHSATLSALAALEAAWRENDTPSDALVWWRAVDELQRQNLYTSCLRHSSNCEGSRKPAPQVA